MRQTASPLDQNEVFAFVKAGLERGDAPSVIAAGVEETHGITTTKDSIRRFRERHGIKAAKKVKIKTKKPDPTPIPVPKPLFQYSIIEQDGEKCITVFAPGETPRVADSTHPNFEAMVEMAQAHNTDIFKLFDVEKIIRETFERLSERVLVRDGHIFFDGDEIHNALTEHIVRVLDQDIDDWEPLVLFLEKVMDNPVPHSREQLYRWLQSHDFSINAEGDIVAYKGVKRIDEDDEAESLRAKHEYLSLNGGHAIVDGDEINGKVPQSIGSTVEMPRQEVIHEPSVSCSYGLHIGTFPYAKNYGEVVLKVIVNPRDVVSVPNGEDEKARTCRYFVEQEVSAPFKSAIVISGEDAVKDEAEEDAGGCDHCEDYYEGGECCYCGES